ncbi:hypothetical protein SCUCBS95973_000307 [Sporothrix curviconia]|uniref:Uncharacterized protein n=1 Tax=Sporothrix curviconia TaxID=1260050 RepID=A0ABP0AP28_9PEZI
MVFSGKPSTGCQMCRTRRIKTGASAAEKRARTTARKKAVAALRGGQAGQAGPTTAEQARQDAAITLPARAAAGPSGSSDTDSLDESIAKASLRYITSQSQEGQGSGYVYDFAVSDTSSGGNGTLVNSGYSSKKSRHHYGSIMPALHMPPDELAVCHFFSNFVLVPFQGSGRGYMDFLVPLMKTSESPTSLFASVSSKEAAALRDTRAADAPSRGTASALATNTDTEARAALSIAFRACALASMAPDLGTDWWMTGAVSDSVAAACQSLAIRTATLRARAADCLASTPDRSPENVARVMGLAQQAAAIDRDCAMWEANVPAEWQFQTVAWYDKLPEGGDYGRAQAFPGKVDVYRDIYIASVWNMVRATRLGLASIGVRCAAWACAPADYRTTSQYAAAARTCSDIITDVIASVPFYLGWQQDGHGRRPGQTPASQQPGTTSPPFAPAAADGNAAQTASEREPTPGLGYVCGDESGLKGLAGYFLAWPLSNINSQDYTTDDQRAWVIGRLKYISNELGVRYAGFVAELKLRVPSMMIRRDRLMAQKQHLASLHNMLSASSASGGSMASTSTPVSLASPESDTSSTSMPPGGKDLPLNPLQQWEALQKQSLDADRDELVARASNNSGPFGTYVAERILHV